MKMTDEQYVNSGGNSCPNCRSKNITAGHCDLDGIFAILPIRCEDCKSTWNDQYKLIGYENLEVPSTQ